MRQAKKILLSTIFAVLLLSTSQSEAQVGYGYNYGHSPHYRSVYNGGYGYSTNRYLNASNYYDRAIFYNSNVVKKQSPRKKQRLLKRECRKAIKR